MNKDAHKSVPAIISYRQKYGFHEHFISLDFSLSYRIVSKTNHANNLKTIGAYEMVFFSLITFLFPVRLIKNSMINGPINNIPTVHSIDKIHAPN